MLHLYAEGMMQRFQNLKFSVLVPLVLEHLLYRNVLPCFGYCRLEHNAKRTVPDNLLRVIGNTLLFKI